jgi:DNA-directed RNA polymerase subunit RPC12/RpoP
MQTEMRVKLNNYLKQFPASRLAEFNCTDCGAEIGTLKPESGEANYTSLVSCPDCDHIMFKIVSSDGTVINGTP